MEPYTGIDILRSSHLSFHATRNGDGLCLGKGNTEFHRSAMTHQLWLDWMNLTIQQDWTVLDFESSSARHSICNHNSPFRGDSRRYVATMNGSLSTPNS